MNKIDTVGAVELAQMNRRNIDSYEEVAQQVSRVAKVDNSLTNNIKSEFSDEDELLSQEEVDQLLAKELMMQNTLRQVKQSQQRLKEILNED